MNVSTIVDRFQILIHHPSALSSCTLCPWWFNDFQFEAWWRRSLVGFFALGFVAIILVAFAAIFGLPALEEFFRRAKHAQYE